MSKTLVCRSLFVLRWPWSSSCILSSKSQRSSVIRGILASGTSISPVQGSRTLLLETVIRNDTSFKGSALIDSVGEGNFIDENYARERALPIYSLNPPITAHSLDGHKLMTISFITGALLN